MLCRNVHEHFQRVINLSLGLVSKISWRIIFWRDVFLSTDVKNIKWLAQTWKFYIRWHSCNQNIFKFMVNNDSSHFLSDQFVLIAVTLFREREYYLGRWSLRFISIWILVIFYADKIQDIQQWFRCFQVAHSTCLRNYLIVRN